MGLIGRQNTSGAFLKLDDITSQFNGSTTTFNLTLGGQAFFAGNPYSLLVSLGGVIQEPISAFTISENQINFASAPTSGDDLFIVVLATTTNLDSLRTLTIGLRDDPAYRMDLHGRSMGVKGRDGTMHSIAFNLA
tara:strand:+ start:320 stop:724 length:405 start_codon:yes stop_codon:yes gene_type:complete